MDIKLVFSQLQEITWWILGTTIWLTVLIFIVDRGIEKRFKDIEKKLERIEDVLIK